jgi:hypothetical protein
LTCLASLAAGLGQVGKAGVILDPAAGSTNMGTFNGAHVPVNAINQSGLSTGYTSLVTDFDTYIASNPTHNTINNDWISASGTIIGNFDFDLGAAFTIQSMALWDIGGNNGSNLIGFQLLADTTSAFSNPTDLGSFTANPNTGLLTAGLPEVFTFAPTSAEFVRMVITSNNGAAQTGFGEAAFDVSAAPEPASATMLLFGCGLIGIFVYRNRG